MITTAMTESSYAVMPKRIPQPTGACPGAGKKILPDLEKPGNFACNDLAVVRVREDLFGNSRPAGRENVPCVKSLSRKHTLCHREIRSETQKRGRTSVRPRKREKESSFLEQLGCTTGQRIEDALAHAVLTAIRFGCASARFAMVTCSTPSLSSAPIESGSADSGNTRLRVTLPNARSLCHCL